MKSWNVTGNAVCAEVIELMNVTPEDCALLAALAPIAKENSAAMVAEFHGRLKQKENTNQYFEGVDVGRVAKMVAMWFEDLFSGKYDVAYADKRMVIGQTHVRIGLPVRYPLAMLDVVLSHGEKVAATSSEPVKALSAFKKVLALDFAIFNQAYEDRQLKHLSELVGGDRLARRLLTGQQ